MKLIRLPMGCFSSRSTIAPTESAENVITTGVKSKASANGYTNVMPSANGKRTDRIRNGNNAADNLNNAGNPTKNTGRQLNNKTNSFSSSIEAPDDDIMSILISSQEKSSEQENNMQVNERDVESRLALHEKLDGIKQNGSAEVMIRLANEVPESGKKLNGSSFDEEPNLDLLRQYVAVDYEIAQLEDKDALRVYHEKIEQLEQLERELDMISSEAEEVAVRNESSSEKLARLESPGESGSIQRLMDSKVDGENSSIISDATGSMSHKSWLADAANPAKNNSIRRKGAAKSGRRTPVRASGAINNGKPREGADSGSLAHTADGRQASTIRTRRFNSNQNSNGISQPYLTIEEVFNRKIILEKERDKLKKEVEIVIVECDKLQQRYKKRDEILDKLFDGRTGGGLENHLEQQLNWLLEQKHYVDQVFYAWKRAETLTSQTCEQFASALELLKRLPRVEELEHRVELVNNIGQLLIKSRQDMEQAQKYNPNVDAPFFTDNETERFDRIIELITSSNSPLVAASPSSAVSKSASNDNLSTSSSASILTGSDNSTISPTAYSQTLTVIQFAHKRAVSIRLWLEQILQTTIARDTFELAEEYKWIAIQLRKERINLIRSKLQEAPYLAMAQAVREQMERQQSLVDSRQQLEINRDSGVESETNDIDIEEEIYRLLELNKWRLEAAAAPPPPTRPPPTAQLAQSMAAIMPTTDKYRLVSGGSGNLLGQQPVANPTGTASRPTANQSSRSSYRDPNEAGASALAAPANPQAGRQSTTTTTMAPSANGDQANMSKTSSLSSLTMAGKLKIELDEEVRQSLLKQVDQIHAQHRNKLDKLRDNNKALAINSIVNRVQLAQQMQKQQQQQKEQQQQQQQAQTGNETGPNEALAAN